MKKHSKTFEAVVYPGARHAFFNDSNPTCHVAHARDAFARTLVFLNETIGMSADTPTKKSLSTDG